MKERKTAFPVIVAHSIPSEQARVTSILERGGLFQVTFTTHSGLECLRHALDSRPALVILDAVLDQIDGLEVLRRLRELPEPRPRCLMVTAFGNYVQEYAQCLGADYCLIAPYSDKALVDSARMLVLPQSLSFTDRQIDAVTTQVLRDLDAPSRLKGYSYVREGVRLLIRDPDLVRRRRVVKDLYGTIAAQHGLACGQSIERAMRTLVDHVFRHSAPDSRAKYFSGADLRQSHANNTDFLLALAHFVETTLGPAPVDQSAAQG